MTHVSDWPSLSRCALSKAGLGDSLTQLADFQGLLILCPQQLFPRPALLGGHTLVRNVQSQVLGLLLRVWAEGGRVLPTIGQRTAPVPSYPSPTQGHSLARQWGLASLPLV